MGDILEGSADGLTRLQAKISEAADRLADTREPTEAAGADLLAAARQAAPRDTGHLRGRHHLTTTKSTATVSAPTAYTARQHFVQQQGRPPHLWLWETLRRLTEQIVTEHEHHAERSIRDVGGQY